MKTRPNGRNILFLITKSNFGGAQRYVHDLAIGLSRNRWEVTVAFGGTDVPGSSTGKLQESLSRDNIQTVFLKHLVRDVFLLLEIRAFFEILGLIRRIRPAVLHTNSSKAGGLGAAAGRFLGVPRIVFTSHGIVYEESRPRWQRPIIKFFTWLTIICAHATIAISRENYERLRSLPFARGKIHLVHNGMGEIHFHKRKEAREFLISCSDGGHIPLDVPWIGTISELTRNKGLSYALEACGQLKNAGHRFVYVIMGDGEDRLALERQKQELHIEADVYLLGFVPQAREYLRALDIFTLTSVKEGLPYVLMEAGLAELPVVATEVGGVSDIIKHETTGLLVKPKSSQAIAESLERFLTDTQYGTTLGRALSTSIRKQFPLKRMIDATERIYPSDS